MGASLEASATKSGFKEQGLMDNRTAPGCRPNFRNLITSARTLQDSEGPCRLCFGDSRILTQETFEGAPVPRPPRHRPQKLSELSGRKKLLHRMLWTANAAVRKSQLPAAFDRGGYRKSNRSSHHSLWCLPE